MEAQTLSLREAHADFDQNALLRFLVTGVKTNAKKSVSAIGQKHVLLE